MQGARPRILYRRFNGQPLSIREDRQIASGGEGAVYALDEFPDLVAKVYHSPRSAIGDKLTLMVDNPPTMPERDGHVSIAWPLDTLHSALPAEAANTVGFVMRKVTSMEEVSKCFSPSDRKQNFPHFTYRHLCTIAINTAIAVGAIHAQGYVIGDINESNIMVNENGLVTLIDTDSFQVIDRSTGKVFRSPVGKPEFVPPELQGHSFDSVDREQHHDAFGLGVIIYLLLMEGWHPFAGVYIGPGEDPAIEVNIQRGHFIHSENVGVPIVDGPVSMPWLMLDETIRSRFRECFDTGLREPRARPTAYHWEEAISNAAASLTVCTRSARHQYFGHNTDCPWCERKNRLGGQDISFPEYSGPSPQPLIMRERTPTPSPVVRPQFQRTTRPQDRPSRGSISIPTDPRTVWATLLFIIVILGLVGWGVVSILNSLESEPTGPNIPSDAAFGESSVPNAALPPTPMPITIPVVPVLPPPETPTPSPTVGPSPPTTPLPPTPPPVSLLAPPPPPTATPEPTPTRQPVPVKPDLTLQVGTFAWHPENPSLGDPVTFSISIINGGGEAAPSKLGYRIYSVTSHAEPVSEGVIDVPGIPWGGQAVVSFDWIAQRGHHSLEIEVDVTEQLDESAETNNSETQLLYNGTVLADLVVESITWSPDVPSMGEPVTVSVTINNRDEGRARANTAQLFVESDLIGQVDLQEIPPGETETVNFDWIAQVGTRNLRVLVDSSQEVTETDEENNELIVPYEATTFADLAVEEISWDPRSPSVGDEVEFSVVIRNKGTLDTGETTVGLLGLPTDDADFSGVIPLGAVLAGNSAVATFPWRAQPGKFTLTGRVDVHQEVLESNEDNNESDVQYSATVLADLTVTGVSWKPERPAVGQEVTITVTAQNQGAGYGTESSVKLLINGVEHREPQSLRGLSSGASDMVEFSWTALTGAHTFSAVVDHDGSVYESDEANNHSKMVKYDGTRVADLFVRTVDWRPETPSVGETVTFRVTVENQGDAAARNFHVSFRDKSSVWPPLEEMISGRLASGKKITVRFQWPADTDPHEFVVVADSRDEVTESDEDNNDHTLGYAATVASDLTVSSIKSAPESPSVNEDATIKVTIENIGLGGANAFILSLTINGPSGEIDSFNKRVEEMAAGVSRTEEFHWQAKLGSNEFTAVVDSRGVVVETDEANNVLVRIVETALADLIVTDVDLLSVNPSVGELVGIGFEIRNSGRGKSGRFIVSIYTGGSDRPFSSERTGSLDRNEARHMDFRWEAVEGCHTFRVVVDDLNNVPEEDESNNQSPDIEICVSGSS